MVKPKLKSGIIERVHIFQIIRWVLTRAVIFYGVIFLVSNVVIDYEKIRFGIKIRIIDNMMPNSFRHLTDLAQGKVLADQDQLRIVYIPFYEKIVAFFPDQSDAMGMLAYCYFFNGRARDAFLLYQKASELSSGCFWFHYNLGVLYFRDGNFANARNEFKKASVTSFADTANFINSSKIVYRSLLLADPGFGPSALKRFKVASRNAAAFVNLCDEILKSDIPIEKLKKGIFLWEKYHLDINKIQPAIF